MLLVILTIIVAVALWILYHKLFHVAYFSLYHGLLKEIFICLFLACVIVGAIAYPFIKKDDSTSDYDAEWSLDESNTSSGSVNTGSHSDDGFTEQVEPVDINVFVPEKMGNVIGDIADCYNESSPNSHVFVTYGASNMLSSSIRQSIEYQQKTCDLFISDTQESMNMLDGEDTSGINTTGSDCIYSDTRIDFASDNLVLAVADGNPQGISSFLDLKNTNSPILITGVMDEFRDIVADDNAIALLDYLDLDIDQLLDDGRARIFDSGDYNSILLGDLKSGYDFYCGIVYTSDAVKYNLTIVDWASDEMCGQRFYPAAIVKNGSQESRNAAQAFLDYLCTDNSAISQLESYGFSVVDPNVSLGEESGSNENDTSVSQAPADTSNTGFNNNSNSPTPPDESPIAQGMSEENSVAVQPILGDYKLYSWPASIDHNTYWIWSRISISKSDNGNALILHAEMHGSIDDLKVDREYTGELYMQDENFYVLENIDHGAILELRYDTDGDRLILFEQGNIGDSDIFFGDTYVRVPSY